MRANWSESRVLSASASLSSMLLSEKAKETASFNPSLSRSGSKIASGVVFEPERSFASSA